MNSRKSDHLKISLEKKVESGDAGFGKFRLEHQAAPELDFEEISLEIEFLGKKLKHPLIIEGMTGGIKEAKKINLDLAQVAQEFGIGFGVGSQRNAFRDKSLIDTYQVREKAPDIFLMANLGAVQLNYGYGLKECQRAIEMIKADALALHLNPLQEALQPEGNKNFSELIEKVNEIASKLKKPVIVKETGCGISYEVAKKLKVSAIDVAGLGGTSFSLIEGFRGKEDIFQISKVFSDWGIPTSECILELGKLNLPLIASGGIRNGLQAAKAFALGATCLGLALPLLRVWDKEGKKGVRKFLEQFFLELKVALFLTGSKNIQEIKGKIKKHHFF